MENPTIGIKIADGSYFPILEEGNSKRKRLVLTTVNDDQESVQIDLYKGEGNEFLDAVYVGSLLIENIVPGPKELSEIELKIGFDQDGNLNAEAGDIVSGQFESLSISVETLGEASMYDVPEFSLDDSPDELKIDEEDGLDFDDLELDSEELSLNEDDFEFPDEEEPDREFDDILDDDLTAISLDSEDPEESLEDTVDNNNEDNNYTPGFLSDSELVHRKERKGTNPFLIALFVIIAIAVIGGISYLIFRSLHGENPPILEAASENNAAGSGGAENSSPNVETAVPAVAVTETKANKTEAKVEDAAATTVSTSEEQQLDETSTASENSVQESLRVKDNTGVWYKIR